MKRSNRVGMVMLLLPAAASGGTALQDDWSGSSGVLGPVTDWGCDFYFGSGIDPGTSPGQISLSGEIARNTVSDSVTDVFSVDAGDMDGDGKLDILGGSISEGPLRWWRNLDGSGTLWEEHVISDSSGIRRAAFADVNGDGYLDVVAGVGNVITWFENEDGFGTSWGAHSVKESSSTVYFVDCGDINGDGSWDIVAAEHYSDSIYWYENDDGTGTSWIMRTLDDQPGGPYCLLIRDMDGDGDGDIIGSLFFDLQICWWENANGQGTDWTRHQVGGTIMDPRYLDTCDLDGDGDLDVIGTGYDEVFWYENTDGSATAWEMHVIDGDFLGAHDVKGGDLDGDGDIDVLTVSFNTEEILWWENLDGAGTSWSEHILDPSFEDGCAVCAEDIDGNGTPDPIGAAYVDDEITWWNLSAFSSGYLESSILDTQDQPDWDMLDIFGDIPPGTSVGCQLRCSDDHTQMGSWSDTLGPPADLEGVLEDGKRYLQYRIVMETADPSVTPSADQIIVSWNTLGLHEPPPDRPSLSALGNPSSDGMVLELRLPAGMFVRLTLFEVSGRLLKEVNRSFGPGVHQVVMNDIPPGVYHVRLEAEDFVLETRTVLLAR